MSATTPAKPTLLLMAGALISGCTTTESFDARSFPAEELRAVQVTLDNGDLSLLGNSTDVATVEARVYGYAGKEEVATRNHDGVSWTADVQSGILTVNSHSEYERAGVDLDLSVPRDAEVLVEAEGDVELAGLRGPVIVTASNIDLRDSAGNMQLSADSSIHVEEVSGDLFLVAEGSVYADLLPNVGDHIQILSGSSGVNVVLPYGVPVDLEVWGDPEYEVIVEDLGFDRVATAPGFFSGVAGRGSVRVEIEAVGGPVTVQGGW
jgi:hypothetical protein